MMVRDLEEAKAKIKDIMSWENIVESLPMVFAIGVVLFIADKLVGISAKIKTKRRWKKYKKNVLLY